MPSFLNKLRDRKEVKRAWLVGFTSFVCFSAFSSFYGFALDLQNERCLPWRLMFLYPVGQEPIRAGDLVQFISVPPNFFGKNNGGSAGKMVSGVPGDHVLVRGGHASVNSVPLADLEDRAATRLNRSMDSFDAEYTLGSDEYFVTGTMPHSFDSRYWGPIKRAQIQKRLVGIL